MTSKETCRLSHTCLIFHRRILEIGGGSTGLCGLCLASSPHHLCREIVITDGHPDCVFNQVLRHLSSVSIKYQNICLQMCQQSKSILPNTNVSCHRLLWQQNDPNNELHSLLYPSHSSSTSPSLFDCIIAADCMFFKDFHSDLLWILNSALSDNGVVYMLQPKRGDTMDRFLSLAQSFFHISVVENYSSKVCLALRLLVSDIYSL